MIFVSCVILHPKLTAGSTVQFFAEVAPSCRRDMGSIGLPPGRLAEVAQINCFDSFSIASLGVVLGLGPGALGM